MNKIFDKEKNSAERMTFVKFWAEYVWTHEDKEWSEQQKALIDSQFWYEFFKINNGFDLMAEVIFNNVKELEELYEEVEKTFKITANSRSGLSSH